MFRRRRLIRRTSKHFRDLSVSELYSYAYYMYLIGRTFDECSTPIEFYMITYDLVRKLGRLEEYSLALQECVKDLEEKNYLKLITRKTEKGENSAYKYTIDNEIFREGNNEYQEI